MARDREVKVTVLGEDRGGKKVLADLGEQADKTDSKLGKLGDGITKFGKAAAVGFGAAVVGGVAFLKGAADAAEESRKVAAQTEAVFKSTENAANVSIAAQDRLATSLSNLTGIDDELISSNANLLRTFTNVRDEVGEGNDIFSQANKTILDMSVALGQDGKASAIQLGKALNDPIKGITALSRAGVSFTEQQKDQIKTLVESGDVLSAQKVILAELNKEFGGSAEAAASPMAKLKVAFGNLQESVGALLLPGLGKAATGLSGFLVKFQSGLTEGQRNGKDFATNVGTSLRVLVGSFIHADDGVTSSGFFGTLERIGIATREIWEKVRAAWPQVRDTIVDAVQVVVGLVRAHWPEIRKVVVDTVRTVVEVVKSAVTIVQTIWRNFGDQIVDVVRTAWRFVTDAISTALQAIRGIVQIITGLIQGDWSLVWEGVKSILGAAWQAIQTIIVTALSLVRSVMSAGWDLVKGVVTGAWDAIIGAVREGATFLVDKVLAALEWIVRGAAGAFGWVPGIGPKLREAAEEFERFRDNVNRSLRGIEDKTVTLTVVQKSTGREFGPDRTGIGYSSGGSVPGEGSGDTVPALLTPGEFVLRRAAAQRIGLPTLNRLNRMAAGGPVGAVGPGAGMVVQLVVDGRVLAEVTADADRDVSLHRARRGIQGAA